MAIPPNFVEELRSRLPIAGLIGRHVRLQRRGREHVGLCPFHNEKTPSFTVSDDKGFFHCFGCGAHGDVVGFLMRSQSLSFPDAVERLAREAGLEVPASSPEERRQAEQRATLHTVLEAAAAWFEKQLQNPLGRPALDYLRGRGIADETTARFRLGYSPRGRTALRDALTGPTFSESLLIEAGLVIRPEDGRAPYDRFRGRLMFPITDRRGRVIAFGGRILDAGEPKYLNSPETPLFHKGRVLYGLAQALRPGRDGELIVCEGYMDVIALSQAGFTGAVAPLGTALTESQLAEAWRLADEPVLCFDGDAAGQRAAARAVERALPMLQPGKSVRFALLPPGEDPDSLVRSQGPAAVRELLAEARPLVEMLWNLETAGRPADTPERRAGLFQRLTARARTIANRAVQENYLAQFKTRVYPERLEQRGFRSKSRGGQRPMTSEIGGAAARLGTRALERQREEIILALLVNHPSLAVDFAEELASVSFQSTGLDRLRGAVIDHAAVQSDLDSEGLRLHLSEIGFAEELQGLLTRTSDKPFTRSTAPVEGAGKALRHQLALMRERQTRREKDLAAQQLGEDGERIEQHYSRFNSLRHAALEGESKRRDIDPFEA